MIKVVFVYPDESKVEVSAVEGDTVLDAAQQNGIEIEGVCSGALACLACNVNIADDWVSKIDAPSDREKEALDFIPNRCCTSRFACQVKLTKEMDGIIVYIPSSDCSCCCS